MSTIDEALTRILQLDGALGASVVDSSSGMMLGAKGAGGTFSLEVAAAGNTDVVRAKRKTLETLGLEDAIEDILITLGRQYHLIRLIRSSPSLFIYVVMDRERGNLAMARHVLGTVESSLQL